MVATEDLHELHRREHEREAAELAERPGVGLDAADREPALVGAGLKLGEQLRIGVERRDVEAGGGEV